MKFDENQTIFIQIAEQFRRDILKGRWKEDERLPSIRETAVELQVNPNTVAKSYIELEDNEVIYKQRGLGYYVASGAKDRIMKKKKTEFFQKDLPEIFRNLEMLNIGTDELCDLYDKFVNNREKGQE